MYKLKNKNTGVEHIITGSIGVPREVSENTFEVWTHFSVDTNGEGLIETIEVPPIDPEWEVIDVPDPAVEPEPEPIQPDSLPFNPPTQEDLARNEWYRRKAALREKIQELRDGKEIGLTPTAEQLAYLQAEGAWIDENRKSDYY